MVTDRTLQVTKKKSSFHSWGRQHQKSSHWFQQISRSMATLLLGCLSGFVTSTKVLRGRSNKACQMVPHPPIKQRILTNAVGRSNQTALVQWHNQSTSGFSPTSLLSITTKCNRGGKNINLQRPYWSLQTNKHGSPTPASARSIQPKPPQLAYAAAGYCPSIHHHRHFHCPCEPPFQ